MTPLRWRQFSAEGSRGSHIANAKIQIYTRFLFYVAVQALTYYKPARSIIIWNPAPKIKILLKGSDLV
jgi:hypothetical protein